MRRFWRRSEVAAQERADRALLQRCCEGDLDSLRVLCHRLAPAAYVAAAMVARTEADAIALFEEMWQVLLAGLPRSRRAGSLRRWMAAGSLSLLSRHAGRRAARRALKAAARVARTEGEALEAPVEGLTAVEALLPAAAERLATVAETDRVWTARTKLVYRVGAALVVVLVGGLLIRRLPTHDDRAVLAGVREYVIRAELASRLREAAAQFDSVTAPDPETAATFDRVGLVLVELAALPPNAGASDVYWIRERVRSHALDEFLTARAEDAEGNVQTDLLDAALVLGEVAAL